MDQEQYDNMELIFFMKLWDVEDPVYLTCDPQHTGTVYVPDEQNHG